MPFDVIQDLKEYHQTLEPTYSAWFPNPLASILQDNNATPLNILKIALTFHAYQWIFSGLHRFYQHPKTKIWNVLNQNQLLSQQTLEAVGNHPNPELLLASVLIMRDASLFTGPKGQANFDQLIAVDTAQIIIHRPTESKATLNKLKRSGLLKKENAQKNIDTCFAAKDSPYQVARSVKYLCRSGIDNDKNRQFLSNMPRFSQEMSLILKITYHHNLLTRDNFTAIAKHPCDYTLHAESPPEILEPGKIYITPVNNTVQVTLLSARDERIEANIDLSEFEPDDNRESTPDLSLMSEKEKFLQFAHQQLPNDQASNFSQDWILNILGYLSNHRHHIALNVNELYQALLIAAYPTYIQVPDTLFAEHNARYKNLLLGKRSQDVFNFLTRCRAYPGVGMAIIVTVLDLHELKLYHLLTQNNLSLLAERHTLAFIGVVLKNFETGRLREHPQFELCFRQALEHEQPSLIATTYGFTNWIGFLQRPNAPEFIDAIARAEQLEQLTVALGALHVTRIFQSDLALNNLNQLITYQSIFFPTTSDDNANEGIFRNIPPNFTQAQFDTLIRIAACQEASDFISLRHELNVPRNHPAPNPLPQSDSITQGELIPEQSSEPTHEQQAEQPDSHQELLLDYVNKLKAESAVRFLEEFIAFVDDVVMAQIGPHRGDNTDTDAVTVASSDPGIDDELENSQPLLTSNALTNPPVMTLIRGPGDFSIFRGSDTDFPEEKSEASDNTARSEINRHDSNQIGVNQNNDDESTESDNRFNYYA